MILTLTDRRQVSGYNDRYDWMRASGEGTQLSGPQIAESIDASLSRLETDHIDVLLLHWPERPVGLTNGAEVTRRRGVTPIEEQVRGPASVGHATRAT